MKTVWRTVTLSLVACTISRWLNTLTTGTGVKLGSAQRWDRGLRVASCNISVIFVLFKITIILSPAPATPPAWQRAAPAPRAPSSWRRLFARSCAQSPGAWWRAPAAA